MTIQNPKYPNLPKASAPVVVVPASGVMPLKTMDDWRALVHQIAPIVVTTLVGIHLVTESQVSLWLPVVFAIVDNILSVGSTTERVRKAIYAVLLLLQSGSAVTTIVGSLVDAPQDVTNVSSIVTGGLTIMSSILARFYTQTSTMLPNLKPGLDIKDVVPDNLKTLL